MENNPSSETAGVKPFSIEGPMHSERHRLTVGMTDEDRAWRKQFLEDQILKENEPIPIPGYYQARYNPIRRLYRWPLQTVFNKLTPKLGVERAETLRWITGKYIMMFFGVYIGAYYFKYHQNDWMRKSGWRVMTSCTPVLPGDEGYPQTTNKTPQEFASQNFENSPI